MPDEDISASEGRALELERVVEALIFAADEPVAATHIADVFAEVTGEESPAVQQVECAIERLNAAYAETGRVLRIHAWANGYRMATAPDVAPYLKTYFDRDRQRRLSRSLMETLAVVAYRQPVTKPEVDFVRGVNADYALRKLLEIGLIDVIGRDDSVGRPLIYGTTDEFLEEFGLRDVDELPNLREIEELLDDPAFNKRRAKLLMERGLEAKPSPNADEGADEEATDPDDA